MRLLAAFIAIPVAVVGWQLWSDRSFEQRLRPIAVGVAGRSVSVDCQSFWGGLIDAQGRDGEVRFDASGAPERKLFLTHRTCKRLRAFAKQARHSELDCLGEVDWLAADPLPFSSQCYERSANTIYAVMILAHESYHTAGVTDEPTTNCFAIQAMAWTAVELGAPVEEAELVARAMQALAPKQSSEYATNECRAGSRLDLHPETATFPTELPLAPPLGRGGVSTLPS